MVARAAAGIIPAVIPLVLVAAGVLALAAGSASLRRLGAGARLGRILAATPVVPVAAARAMAEAGTRRYVGVQGRIDAEEEFEDEHQRPLVYRRTRLELRGPHGWRPIHDGREVVPFEIVETLATVAVDAGALDEGLIVVVRESEGTAADIRDRVPEETPPGTPVRLRVEQLSSVDHALVLGVPALDAERGPILGPGLGRPLILTNLERDEALRLLAAGRRGTAWLASALFAGGLGLVGAGIIWGVVDVLA